VLFVLLICVKWGSAFGALGETGTVPEGGAGSGWPIEAWVAGTSDSQTVYRDGFYNHQPVIVKDLDGAYVVFWTGHPMLLREGARGQVIYAAKSTDQGNTWSERFTPFQSSEYTSNAHVPSHSEWQPRAAQVRVGGGLETWVAYTVGRGSADQGAVLARKAAAGGQFRRYRLVQSSQAGGIHSVPADDADARPLDYSPLWSAEGRMWFPFPQSIVQIADGTILMTLTLLSPSDAFAVAEKRFAVVRYDGQRWSLSSLAPLGEMPATDSWESAIQESAGGRLTAYIRDNNIRNPRGYRLAVSHSDDGGRTWSPCTWARMPIHSEQPSIAFLSEQHAVLAIPDHTTHRNNQSLILLGAGTATFGLGVSQERDQQEFAHASFVLFDRDRGRLLMVWSQGAVGRVPNEIRFRSIDPPAEGVLNLIIRRNAAYELDDASQIARWDAVSRQLRVTGRASAGLELPAGVNEVQLVVVRPPLGPKSNHAVLAALGTYLHHVIWQFAKDETGERVLIIEVRRDGALINRRLVATVPVDGRPNEVKLAIFFDATTGRVNAGGFEMVIEQPWSFFLGDGYLEGSGDRDASLAYDLSLGVVFRCRPPRATLTACAAGR